MKTLKKKKNTRGRGRGVEKKKGEKQRAWGQARGTGGESPLSGDPASQKEGRTRTKSNDQSGRGEGMKDGWTGEKKIGGRGSENPKFSSMKKNGQQQKTEGGRGGGQKFHSPKAK